MMHPRGPITELLRLPAGEVSGNFIELEVAVHTKRRLPNWSLTVKIFVVDEKSG